MKNLVLLIFFINLFLSLFIFLKANRLFVGASFIFFLIYLVSYFIGSIIVVVNHSVIEIKDLKFIFIVTSYLLFFSIGVYLAKKSSISLIFTKFFYKKILSLKKNSSISKPILNFILILLAIPSFLLGILYFSNGIPVLSNDVENARLEAIAGHNLNFLLLTYVFPVIILLLSINKIAKLILFLFAILINFATGFKSAVARIILVIFVYRNTYKKVKFVEFLSFFIVIFLALMFIVFLKFREKGLDFVLYRTLARIFLFNPHDMYEIIVNIFPNKYDFLMGRALIMDFVALKPGHDISFDGWMYYEIYGTYVSAINSSVGGVWADFAWGYIPIIIMWGVVLSSFDEVISKYKLSSQERVLYASLAVALGHTANSLYAKNFAFVFPLVFIILILRFLYFIVYESMRYGNIGVRKNGQS